MTGSVSAGDGLAVQSGNKQLLTPSLDEVPCTSVFVEVPSLPQSSGILVERVDS